MNKSTIYVGLLALTTGLASCDDYLSKNPNEGGDEVLNKAEQIEKLFANSEKTLSSYAVYQLSSSDDFGWTTDIIDQTYSADYKVFNGIAWDVDGLKSDTYGDETWSTEYTRIFYANLILNEIDEVTDLTDTQRTDYLAHAHYLRAISNWELASMYCRPYATETLSTLGLPLKKTTDYEESQERASLEATYKFIEDDLLEAYSTTRTDIETRWKVSRPAVAAMLSRFYLFTCQYDKAVSYADEALKSSVAKLIDFNTLTHIEMSYDNGGDDYGYDYYDSGDGSSDGYDDSYGDSDDGSSSSAMTLLYPQFYGYSATEYTDFTEAYFTNVYRCYDGVYLIPSETLLNLYDQENDLRFDQFFVKGELAAQNGIYIDNDYVYHTFNSDWMGSIMMSGPTVAEVILNKAEAQARQGDYSDAMQTVNLLRVKRMRAGSEGINLTASSQEDAVKKILDERHRELPFIMRWQDIRRLAYNEVDYDDVTPSRSFYVVENNLLDYEQTKTYTLPLKSPRYAQPISELEIKRSGNQLVQNEY